MAKRKRAPLPPPCRLCAPYGGNWAMEATGVVQAGVRRCSCPRGRALAQGAKYGKKQPEKHDGKTEAAKS